ncbi:MAG TPA: hypothetical protein VD999_06610 [Vitreimonas sp.]|nr:hypothetical protein [Vitreimonas sp.]
MRAIESVVKSLKEFTQLTANNLGTLRIPASPHHPRTDNPNVITDEIQHLGTLNMGEYDEYHQIGFATGVTTNPSPHTPIQVDHQQFLNAFNQHFPHQDPEVAVIRSELFKKYEQVPLHLIQWWFGYVADQGKYHLVPRVYEAFFGISRLTTGHLYKNLEANIVNSINTLDKLLIANNQDIKSDLSDRVKVYGVFGHSDKEDQERWGLNRGPQSNLFGHMHVAALPKEVLSKMAAHDQLVDTNQRLKFISPFDAFFTAHLQNFFLELYKPNVETNVETSRTQVHFHNPETHQVSFLDGVKVTFKEALPFWLSMVYVMDMIQWSKSISDTLQRIYWDNLETKNRAVFNKNLTAAIDALKGMGMKKPDAKKLIDALLSLPPTLGQLQFLLNNSSNNKETTGYFKNLFTKHQVHKKPKETHSNLRNLLAKYQRQKKLIESEATKPAVLRVIKKVYDLNDVEAAELLALMADRLKDPQQGETATLTMPAKEAGGYSFDYFINEAGELMVNSFTIVPRLSQKNIYEDLVGYVLTRG